MIEIDQTVRQNIFEKLEEIEANNNIKILFACESGSRGWQFPSPDSDYDVRFIYLKPMKYYLSIAEQTDQLDFPINEELDINGWDLRKVLQLLYKSNSTPFEWLQSPIIYREEERFPQRLVNLGTSYFSRRTQTHHYLGISKGALDTAVNGREIRIKKLFYVLRPLLAALWCVEKNSVPPMMINPLLTLMPTELKDLTEELIALKLTKEESYVIEIPTSLQSYIIDTYRYCEDASKGFEKKRFDYGPLDEFFVNQLDQYEY
ncbi:nucleotidyltransferase domain-containing protein [Olivibacter domesticus]|uniref:Nucleotidyltransferase n=1 Tax=Olivibacter domesticus TaxID=407022 RepID=A0A1H7JV82_OLID1|nr:nucleotidyltransferase domain-containing protein [Olivibacter domesticus]SEK77970.1 hypothetical protein SAMN05661044_01125 [Olivibacter domesticus]